MSKQNVEFVRRGYEALERGDLETFKALSRERLGPEFEFHHVWDGRVFKGYDGTMEWLSDAQETWKDYTQEVEEIIDHGDQVVVVLGISAQGVGSGVPVDPGVRGGLDLRRRDGGPRPLVHVPSRGARSRRARRLRLLPDRWLAVARQPPVAVAEERADDRRRDPRRARNPGDAAAKLEPEPVGDAAGAPRPRARSRARAPRR